MILVYGRLDDPPTSRTVEALQEAGSECVILEQTALERDGLQIELGPHGVDGALVVAGHLIPLDCVHSIFARPLELARRRPHGVAAEPARLLHEQFFEWLDVAPSLVVNRPRAMQPNASKPLQIQLIGAAGFLVPETLVTNSKDEVLAFWREHGRVVYKSASGTRSIVQELDDCAAERLDRVAVLPSQFQAFVPGVDVRVHVVGDRTFAAEIMSSGTDYRYAQREGGETTLAAIELPRDVAARCVSLSRQMELPLSGVDLRRRPDGAYVCLEVNPMPAYTYFEAGTGLLISQALAEMLIGGKEEHSNGPSGREPDETSRANCGAAAASHTE
jgi:hypothetical protein